MTGRDAQYQNSADLREFRVLLIINGWTENQVKMRNSARNYVSLSEMRTRKKAGFWVTGR